MSLCLLRFEEEQQRLEERKKRALENLKRRKGSCTANMAPYSSKTHSTSSLGASERGNISEYQEVGTTLAPPPLSNKEKDKMEERMKQEIVAFEGCSEGEQLRLQVNHMPSNSPNQDRQQQTQAASATVTSNKSVLFQSPPSSVPHIVSHSDSNEWTDYASAPPTTSSTLEPCLQSTSGTASPGSLTDISEFDPISHKKA